MRTFKQISTSNNKYLNDEIGYYKDCNRFLPYERNHDYTTQDAIIYEKLREAGMKKNQAIRFCKAQHCKVDTTQMKNGPPGYKIFKPKIDKLKQLYGWQMTGKLNYIESAPKEYSDDNYWEIQDTNKEEQEKMEQLKQFYTEMDFKYSFTDLDVNETLTKLRSLSNEDNYRGRVPQYQIKDKQNQMIYYEMAEYILKLKKPPKTVIQDLNVFDNTIPLVRQEYYDIQPKIIEKATPIYPKQNYEKRTKLLKELSKAYTGQVTVKVPTEDIKKDFLQIRFQQFQICLRIQIINTK